jgi:hypothetical protein
MTNGASGHADTTNSGPKWAAPEANLRSPDHDDDDVGVFVTRPIAVGFGAGSDLRQPLGVAVVGGLIVSQALTLFTTNVTYLYIERLSSWTALRLAWLRRSAATVPALYFLSCGPAARNHLRMRQSTGNLDGPAKSVAAARR